MKMKIKIKILRKMMESQALQENYDLLDGMHAFFGYDGTALPGMINTLIENGYFEDAMSYYILFAALGGSVVKLPPDEYSLTHMNPRPFNVVGDLEGIHTENGARLFMNSSVRSRVHASNEQDIFSSLSEQLRKFDLDEEETAFFDDFFDFFQSNLKIEKGFSTKDLMMDELASDIIINPFFLKSTFLSTNGEEVIKLRELVQHLPEGYMPSFRYVHFYQKDLKEEDLFFSSNAESISLMCKGLFKSFPLESEFGAAFKKYEVSPKDLLLKKFRIHDLSFLNSCKNLQEIRFYDCKIVNPRAFEGISLPSLKKLVFNDEKPDVLMNSFDSFPNVTHLDLRRTDCTDEHLEKLARDYDVSRIEFLSLEYNKKIDRVDFLEQFSGLKYLTINDTEISNFDMLFKIQGESKIEVVDFKDRIYNFTDFLDFIKKEYNL